MKKLAAFLLFAWLLSLPAWAVDVEGALYDDLGISQAEEAVPPEVREILGDLSVTESLDTEKGFKRLLSGLVTKVQTVARDSVRTIVVVLAVAVLTALAGSMFEGKPPDYLILAAVLAIALAAAGEAGSLILAGTRTLEDLSAFSHILLPCLAAAAAAGGALTSAAAKYAATSIFVDALILLARWAVVPMVYGYMAAVIASAATGNPGLKSAARFLRWLSNWMLTLITLAFTVYLTLTGVITGSADAVTLRLTKTAISTVLPVVGSIVADAAGSVAAGAAILRNAVGIFGLLAICGICMAPFISLGLRYLLYKMVSALVSSVTDSRLSELIGGIGDAFGMVTAMVGSAGLMLFLSIISCLKAVT